MKGFVFLYVIMKKGKGYKLVEIDMIGIWYGIGLYKINIGDFVKLKVVVFLWSGFVSGIV